jgi:hypothetical protein
MSFAFVFLHLYEVGLMGCSGGRGVGDGGSGGWAG